MAARPMELAKALRERRRESGLTRMRLAARCGLSAADVSKWERGEDLPDRDQLVTITGVLGLDDDEVRDWIDILAAPDESENDKAVAVQAGHMADAPVDPPPQPVMQVQGGQSRIDRLRLIWGSRRRSTPPTAGVEDPDGSAPTRSASSRHSALVARPGRQLPAVFPDSQIGSYDPAVRIYSTAPSTYPGPGGEQLYRLRRIRTAIVLLGLGVVLWWASGALGDGFSDVLDLFRGPAEPVVVP